MFHGSVNDKGLWFWCLKAGGVEEIISASHLVYEGKTVMGDVISRYKQCAKCFQNLL